MLETNIFPPTGLRITGLLARGLVPCLLAIGAAQGVSAREVTDCAAEAAYDGPSFRAPLNLPFPAEAGLDLSEPFSAVVSANLDDAWLENIEQTGATAAAITIVQLPAEGTSEPVRSWSTSTGLESGPQAFWWASSGKIVTATVILQLIAEGRLSLDTTIERWFPRFPNADEITIDQLLRHTAGVFTFDNDAKLRGRQDYIPQKMLVAAAARQGSDFCPGTNWLYSNTGYVLLGLIAEQVEAAPFATIVDRRIAGPLGLASMRVVSAKMDPETVVAPKGRPQGSIPAFATIAGAGPVVADTRDMTVLLLAWLNGELIGTQARDRALSDLVPMFSSSASYGQGIMVIDVPEQSLPTTWIGHLGGSPDAKAVLIYDVRRRAYVSLVLNTNSNGEALAMQLLQALN